MACEPHDEIRTALHEHLVRWRLRRFTNDSDYFAWQRQCLSSTTLTQLNSLVERRQGGAGRDEIAFYDFSADDEVLPVLYSQQYAYFEEVGSRVVACIEGVGRTLDFGCGVGILTTFYASRLPDQEFVGIDRSPTSIRAARRMAEMLGLKNVRFECADGIPESFGPSYGAVLSTHVLLQAEQDPGVPSVTWRTFERSRDGGQQGEFERRTGLATRLDQVVAILEQGGHMVVCEKTRQLARRIPFQRALAARGLQVIRTPELIRYQLVAETVDDGPFFVMRKNGEPWLAGDELPEPEGEPPFDRSRGRTRHGHPDDPLYESHQPSAQTTWEGLEDREVIEEYDSQGPEGRQVHIELGRSGLLGYLYCANTFDQRQIVIVEWSRLSILQAYYHEIRNGLI